MHLEFGRRAVPFAMALLSIGLIFTDVSGQKRRTKKSRRATNPVTTAAQAPAPSSSATTSDPTIISTADESAYDSDSTATPSRSTRARRKSASDTGVESTQEKVDRLSAQLTTLTEKMSQMELQQRTLVYLEQLSRAETRGENLRVQLRDVQAQEAEKQAMALQLEYELQPTVIERTLASSGSTRPEDLREQRRRDLLAKKESVQLQLTQLATSRARLETSIANADAEADRLRARIDSALAPTPTETTSTDVGAPPVPTDQTGDMGQGRPQ